MQADYTIDVTNSNDLSKSKFQNDSLENVMIQLVTDGDFDGTTTTATLQESNDGVNFNNIEDSLGNAVEIMLAAPSTSYLLKTGIFYGKTLRVLIDVGNATDGEISVFGNSKE